MTLLRKELMRMTDAQISEELRRRAKPQCGSMGNIYHPDEALLREAASRLQAPAVAEVEDDLEEAVRLAEVGEYLYSRAYSYGDGYTEPREWGIDWQWQQSKPDEYGQGQLLAESTAWHAQQNEDGAVTEATKLRARLATLRTGGSE